MSCPICGMIGSGHVFSHADAKEEPITRASWQCLVCGKWNAGHVQACNHVASGFAEVPTNTQPAVKVVQIQVIQNGPTNGNSSIYALRSDGTIWFSQMCAGAFSVGPWKQIPHPVG
jgi:hypothetical protein